MRTLMFCAVNTGTTVRKSQVAEFCNASENHLAQIIQALGHAGFVTTLRGRGGGLQLARPASEISIGHVFRVLESDLPFAECYSEDKNTCPLIGSCRLRTAFDKALDAFYSELDAFTLEDLVAENRHLDEILRVTDMMAPACNVQTA